jgi:hypothetical protein
VMCDVGYWWNEGVKKGRVRSSGLSHGKAVCVVLNEI